MKKIKHLNIEFDNSNTFELFNKVHELTKGNNIDLLISLTNDIEADFRNKVEEVLEGNKIEYKQNDYDFEKNKIISEDFERFYDNFNIKNYTTKFPKEEQRKQDIEKQFEYKYTFNPNFTEDEMLFHYRTNSDVKYFSAYYYYSTDKTLLIDYQSIRYDRTKHTKELEYFLDYINTVSNYFKDFIYTEHNKTILISSEIANKVKSPQDKIDYYLYNEINIELYDEFSFVYNKENELLQFFNNLFSEFDFFINNNNNYLVIINHFSFSEVSYLFWDDKTYFNPKTEHEKLFELFNLYECLTRLINYTYPLNNRTGALIKTCEHIEKLYQKIHKLYLPDDEITKEIKKEIKKESKDTEPDASTVKKNKPKKALNEFIHNIKDKDKFLQELKSIFPTERGKSIKIIISLLMQENILIIGNREFKDFHSELEAFFNRDIGSRQSINDVKFNDIHKSTIETIEKKLNPLIKNYITN